MAPLLDAFDALADHGLLWVYGYQNYFGDLDSVLSIGTEVPDDDVMTVGNLRFITSLDYVESDVVLVTHMEHWRLADHFEGVAHFCGNSQRSRYKGSRLDSAYLQFRNPETDRKRFGGYFVVDVDSSSGLSVELRSIGELARIEYECHSERGVQFQPRSRCMFCNVKGTLFRGMCASGFYGLTHGSDRETVTDDELIDYAADLWEDPPDGFREEFGVYLAELNDHRYAPLARADDGTIGLAEQSYSY